MSLKECCSYSLAINYTREKLLEIIHCSLTGNVAINLTLFGSVNMEGESSRHSRIFECLFLRPDGRVCGKKFTRTWNLHRHTRTQHQKRNLPGSTFVNTTPESFRDSYHKEHAISDQSLVGEKTVDDGNQVMPPRSGNCHAKGVAYNASSEHLPIHQWALTPGQRPQQSPGQEYLEPAEPAFYSYQNAMLREQPQDTFRSQQSQNSTRDNLMEVSGSDVSRMRSPPEYSSQIEPARQIHKRQAAPSDTSSRQRTNDNRIGMRSHQKLVFDRCRFDEAMPHYEIKTSRQTRGQMKALSWLSVEAKTIFEQHMEQTTSKWGTQDISVRESCLILPYDWVHLEPSHIAERLTSQSCPLWDSKLAVSLTKLSIEYLNLNC